MRAIRAAVSSSVDFTSTEDSRTYDVEDEFRNTVSKTLNSIENVPEGDPLESALLFPLFLVGGEISEEHEMEAVRRRLSAMYETRRFENILRAQQTLESLWTVRQRLEVTFNGRPDWRHVVDHQNVGLLLLLTWIIKPSSVIE